TPRCGCGLPRELPRWAPARQVATRTGGMPPMISTPVDAPVDSGEWGGVTADEIWEQGAAALREQLAPATWTMWFNGVRAVAYDGDTLLLGVPNSLAAERIRSSYSGMLTDAIRDSSGHRVHVDLHVEADARVDVPVRLVPTTTGGARVNRKPVYES